MIDEYGRPEPELTADERTTLDGFIDFHRATLEWKCLGLTAEQLARRPLPPSSLSLLGLLRHVTDVERAWFDRVADAANPRPYLYATPEEPDAAFTAATADEAQVAEAFANWRAAVAESRAVAARTDLDATFVHRVNGPTSLRWVLVHLVEEYCRHNGHADLLREAVDGATGE